MFSFAQGVAIDNVVSFDVTIVIIVLLLLFLRLSSKSLGNLCYSAMVLKS
jgi:hypothetical protein